jgi:predicted nucleic acid-binding protein
LPNKEISAYGENEMKRSFEFIASISEVSPLTSDIAIQAGEVDFMMKKRIRGWPIADSVIYATALLTASKVVSGDPHFESLNNVVFLKRSNS